MTENFETRTVQVTVTFDVDISEQVAFNEVAQSIKDAKSAAQNLKMDAQDTMEDIGTVKNYKVNAK